MRPVRPRLSFLSLVVAATAAACGTASTARSVATSGAAGSGTSAGSGGSSTAPGSATGSATGATSSTSGASNPGSTTATSASNTASSTSSNPDARKLLLRDDGLQQLDYIDLGNRSSDWHVAVPDGNDIQLVGNNRVLVGTGNGYEEHDLTTGAKVSELTSFAGTLSAHRLRNRNTMLAGVNWQGGTGIVLVEVDAAGAVQNTITYSGFSYVRLIRQTPTGTFLVTADKAVFEGNASGQISWQVSVNTTNTSPHAWKALRLPSGDTVVSTGYAASLQIFTSAKTLRQTITGPSNVTPNFYCDFQILPNGDYVVTNWEGHGAGNGNVGVQVLEYNTQGTLVWSWKQDASVISSLQAAIVLDGLDLSQLYVEDTTGTLVAAP